MSFQNPVFIPGPTNMPEVLRKACDMPTIDHRSPLFGQILHPALAGVKKVLKGEKAEVFIFPSTGTGGWETALTNTLSAGDKVLAARNGMFSHRWIDMCNQSRSRHSQRNRDRRQIRYRCRPPCAGRRQASSDAVR